MYAYLTNAATANTITDDIKVDHVFRVFNTNLEYLAYSGNFITHILNKKDRLFDEFNKIRFIKTSIVFGYVFDFRNAINTTVSQGSAAKSLTYGRICNDNFV